MRTQIVIGLVLFFSVGAISTDAHSQMFIFPEKGQSKDQQEFDQFTCSKWAKEQTGIDPNLASAAPAPAAPQGGQALRGAAGGAALGAIGGAIAGNAGQGAAIGAALGGGMGMMRRRRAEMQYEEQVQEASAERQQAQQKFNRAYSVCLEGKGYKVG